MNQPEQSGVSRRALLRGAAVGGAMVWTTPLVQTIARPAFAAGSSMPGTGLSTVSVLVTAPDATTYRMKWEFDDAVRITGVESGPGFAVPTCGTVATNPVCTRGNRGLIANSGQPAPPGVLLSAAGGPQGFQLLLAPAAKVIDWYVHQGQCCLGKGVMENLTTQYGPTGSGYDVSISPGTPAGTTRYTWPLAPNLSPCSLLTPVTSDSSTATISTP